MCKFYGVTLVFGGYIGYNIDARAKCLVSNPTDIKGNAESVGGWRASH